MVNMILSIICGSLFFNAIPHLVKGICGEMHMTPFSRKSSAWVNVIWGWINLIVAAVIAICLNFVTWGVATWIGFGLGGIGISIWLSIFWSNPDARLPWHTDEP